jgi:dienelactone hydrolase
MMNRPQSERGGVRKLSERLRAQKLATISQSRWGKSIIAAVLVALAVGSWPFFKCHLQAIAVLDLVANQAVPGAIRAVVSEPVSAQVVMLDTPHGQVRARLYVPVKHPDAPALIVLHGVHHLGMDEPRLIAFASAMASCGLRVLTPELPDIKDYHVGANSVMTIGDSAAWMAQHNQGRPVGVMGLSFSGGLSLLAAGNPAYRQAIKFIVAVGSQDEMSRVAAYYRTGEDARPVGSTEILAPHEYGALVMEYENLGDFVPAGDVAALREVLRTHLYEEPAKEKAAMAALTPQQSAEAKQLMDTTSTATRAMLAHAETLHIQDMAGVSPHGHLAQLTTPVYLLHGEGDNIIPSAETMWMASELPSESLKAELISPVISHLDMEGHGPSELDRLRLAHFFALVLRAAEK